MKSYMEYWNDIEAEKGKAFFVTGVGDKKLIGYLRDRTNLERCFTDAVAFAEERLGGIGPRVLDVAAGVCWTSAILSRKPGVKEVVAIDYSSHRLLEIAPIVIEQMGGDAQKIRRICEDFMGMALSPVSFDTVLFCQSLYMFGDMAGALKRAAALLRPGGRVVVACERLNVSSFLSAGYLRQMFSNPRHALWALAVRTGARPKADDTGRRFRVDGDYRHAIEKAGLEFNFQPLSYKLWDGLPVNAGNYFGAKVIHE